MSYFDRNRIKDGWEKLCTNKETDRQTKRHYENNGHLAVNQQSGTGDGKNADNNQWHCKPEYTSAAGIDYSQITPGHWAFSVLHCTVNEWRKYLSPVYTIQPVVKPVVKRAWQNGCVVYTAGCQTGCTTRFDNWLNEQWLFVQHGCQTRLTTELTTGCIVYANIQPVVNPVWQPDWQPVGCLFTRYSRLSNRLYNNRFDNRLYRVNGVLEFDACPLQTRDNSSSVIRRWPTAIEGFQLLILLFLDSYTPGVVVPYVNSNASTWHQMSHDYLSWRLQNRMPSSKTGFRFWWVQNRFRFWDPRTCSCVRFGVHWTRQASSWNCIHVTCSKHWLFEFSVKTLSKSMKNSVHLTEFRGGQFRMNPVYRMRWGWFRGGASETGMVGSLSSTLLENAFTHASSRIVCLSVVCNVRAPYSDGSYFRQYFYGIRYLGHPLTTTENFTEVVPGEPLRRVS